MCRTVGMRFGCRWAPAKHCAMWIKTARTKSKHQITALALVPTSQIGHRPGVGQRRDICPHCRPWRAIDRRLNPTLLWRSLANGPGDRPAPAGQPFIRIAIAGNPSNHRVARYAYGIGNLASGLPVTPSGNYLRCPGFSATRRPHLYGPLVAAMRLKALSTAVWSLFTIRPTAGIDSPAA